VCACMGLVMRFLHNVKRDNIKAKGELTYEEISLVKIAMFKHVHSTHYQVEI
jgi:hypothetical protein